MGQCFSLVRFIPSHFYLVCLCSKPTWRCIVQMSRLVGAGWVGGGGADRGGNVFVGSLLTFFYSNSLPLPLRLSVLVYSKADFQVRKAMRLAPSGAEIHLARYISSWARSRYHHWFYIRCGVYMYV
jgi:hypothetical protein